eukprot:jgi/Chlat1/5323/Chrsp35S05262
MALATAAAALVAAVACCPPSALACSRWKQPSTVLKSSVLKGLGVAAARRIPGRRAAVRVTTVAGVDVAQRLQRGPRPEVAGAVTAGLANCLTETSLDDPAHGLRLSSKVQGKVRDTYDAGDAIVIVTTDRQSAFDRLLASVPFKGQVLNETSLWWFDNTTDIIPNAVLSTPDPNVTIARKCTVFPVEFVVRGYITGSTSTSLWTVYNRGDREYCGNILSEGLVRNQKLDQNLLTPTTKDKDHDRPVSPKQIVEMGLMTQADWEYVSAKALELFSYGQKAAAQHGLLLVDTKYEFGRADDGTILLIDEVHTPDSSRYWIAETYNELFAAGKEPANIDKEFLRLWFREHCDPYNDAVLPEAPADLVTELSRRYILLYETITGELFIPPSTEEPVHDRIVRHVRDALKDMQH